MLPLTGEVVMCSARKMLMGGCIPHMSLLEVGKNGKKRKDKIIPRNNWSNLMHR